MKDRTKFKWLLTKNVLLTTYQLSFPSLSLSLQEAGSSPQRPVQLTISEKGVSIFNRAGTTVISSFTYADISTFGGTTDNTFMLIISSQSRRSSSDLRNGSQITAKRNSSSKKTVEKLTFVMPKLKVRKLSKHGLMPGELACSQVVIFSSCETESSC